jgi:hypothetical protein
MLVAMYTTIDLWELVCDTDREGRGKAMGWEVYEKVVRRSTSPILTISKLGRLSFNSASTEVLVKHSVTHVLLLWDRAANKIGIQSAGKKDPRAYTLHFAAKNANSGFAAKTFLHHITYDYNATKSFVPQWNEKESMFEVDIPAESFAAKQIQRFPRERETSGKKGSEAHGQAKATTA